MTAMPKSTTKIVSIDRLARDPKLGSVLVRLMMVLNDCAIADETASIWRANKSERRAVRRQEAFKYFVELQIAHIYEGLKIIKEIKNDPQLSRYVEECDAPTRREFDWLVAFLSDPKFNKTMGRLRHNIIFHYDAGAAEKALLSHIDKYAESYGAISMGRASSEWMFEPGALISEVIAVRHVFGVPYGADVTEASDKVMVELQEVLENYMRFAGHFVWKHTSS